METENPTVLSDYLAEGADYLLAIGCPEDSEVIQLAREVQARVAWLEERSYIKNFFPPIYPAEPSITVFLGWLRVAWQKSNRGRGGALDAAEAAGDFAAKTVIGALNTSSRRLRSILEEAL